ncbi:MAG: PspC domain-containing protein [Bacteroidetes bacterium]|nr:PspC domain-containing protein [Bacteroidota bacterium]MBS1774882.1 PspC domain-containing protein [Bacteroidota bacterium]
MQRIIQINLAGRLIPIEEDAYLALRDYIKSLELHFSNEEGKDEIIQDIEYRIAELFSARLQSGTPCVDKADVTKVIDTLGPAYSISSDNASATNPYLPTRYEPRTTGGQHRLYRNPNDKMLGGVCSGIANYFDIDPVIVRLIMVVLFLTAGIGFLAYIISWIVIPLARTPEEIQYMTGGEPLDFQKFKKNVNDELQDLRKRGEEMSKELRDFFSKKK